MKVVVEGIEYEPKRPPLPAWSHGVIADNFLNETLAQLQREPATWTCAVLDIIDREVACKHAAAALLWYRDECKRLRSELAKSGTAAESGQVL